MRAVFFLLLCLLVAACATPAPQASRPDFLFRDELFVAPSERIDVADVFAVSEPMRHFLRHEVLPKLRNKGAQAALFDALNSRAQLKLEYDTFVTRNAAQAFDARAGNCLSLVVMTAAFAKEMGLQVRYQSAYSEETFSRSSSLLLRSGHVNVTLGRNLADMRSVAYANQWTIDFLPPEDLRGLRTREIDETLVVAMYLNNRAVETLVAGRTSDAYAWVREAIRQHPGYLGALNTLGVIYLRHGEPAQAETVFGHVLHKDPTNTAALSNMARALALLGRVEESQALYRKLAQLEPEPPFHYFNLGMAAMKRDDFRTARELFAKEVARADYNHEFHFWLGVANLRLGEIDKAKKHLTLALENSATRSDRELYAAKLARLKDYRP